MSASRGFLDQVRTLSRPPADESQHKSVIAVGVAAVLVAIALYCEFLVWPDSDATWLLAIARRIMAGSSLYSSDLMEVNPPIIIEFARLVLALSGFSGMTAITTWRLLVFAIELLALGMSLSLLRRALKGDDAHFFLPAAVALATTLGCLPGFNFGQREHLILLLTMPYVLAAALHIDGERLPLVSRVGYGSMLGIALAIKPHYALLVLFVEAGVVVPKRRPLASLRAETVSALVTGLAAAIMVVLRYPDYLSFAVPFAVRYYAGYRELRLSFSHATYLVGSTAAVLAMRRLGLRSTAPKTLLLAGIGSFLAFLAQGKGWAYHFLPAQSYLFFAGVLASLLVGRAVVISWLLARFSLSVHRAAVLVTVAIVVPLLALMARRTININNGHRAGQFSQLKAVIERARPPGSPLTMAALSIEHSPAFPVIEVMGGQWAARYPCLWMIPAIEALERKGGVAARPENSGRQSLITAIGEDLTRYRPTFVLIEGARSRLLDDVLAAPDVQRPLRSYHLTGRVGAIGVWVRETGQRVSRLTQDRSRTYQAPLAMP